MRKYPLILALGILIPQLVLSDCLDVLGLDDGYGAPASPSPALTAIQEVLAESRKKAGNKERIQNTFRDKMVDATLSEREKLEILEQISLHGDRTHSPYSLVTSIISNPAALNTPALKKKMLEIMVFDTPLKRALSKDRKYAVEDLIDRESFSTPFLTYAKELFESQKPKRPMWNHFSKQVAGYLLPKSAKKLVPIPEELFKPLNSRNHKLMYKILGDPDSELTTRQQFRRGLGYLAQAKDQPQKNKVQLWKNIIHGLQESHQGNFEFHPFTSKDGTEIFLSQNTNRFLAITADPEARVIFGGCKYGSDKQEFADNWREGVIFSLEVEPEQF